MWSTKVKKWGGFWGGGDPSEKYSAGAGVAVELPSLYGGDETDSASCKRQALGLARLDDGGRERATFVEEGNLASLVTWRAGCGGIGELAAITSERRTNRQNPGVSAQRDAQPNCRSSGRCTELAALLPCSMWLAVFKMATLAMKSATIHDPCASPSRGEPCFEMSQAAWLTRQTWGQFRSATPKRSSHRLGINRLIVISAAG